MLRYIVRDIGVMNEIKTFISDAKPTKQSCASVERLFPDIADLKSQVGDENEIRNVDDSLSFPHILVGIIGHAGSGKSYILKHLANRPRTLFFTSTNAAGVNLQNTLWDSMLFRSNKKCVFRTIHSFYQIQPDQTQRLGESVLRARRGQFTFSSYNEYLELMYKGCKPFCEMLFAKDMQDGKLTPESYWEYREMYCSNDIDGNDTIHNKVIMYLKSVGLENKIPAILLYDMAVVEESGRCPDYLTFLFLFYYYFMHIKYKTQIWRHVIPTLMLVGSPTQSRVIDEYTPYSALTFLSQPCMKYLIEEQQIIKIKCFKDNRRVIHGDRNKSTILATVVSKLESRMPVSDDLREKFNACFTTEQANFFDPSFKPSYFRIAKRHEDLRNYKNNVFKCNSHNLSTVPEYFYSHLDFKSFSSLERHINVKFRSENYESEWNKLEEKTKLWTQELFSYMTNRKFLIGFQYLLTEYSKLYCKEFVGTINQFLEITNIFQPYMSNSQESNACINFFTDCAKYLIENVYLDEVENLVNDIDLIKSKNKEDSEASIQQLLSLKSLLKQKSDLSKVFMFACEKQGTFISLPKDVFSFVISDIDVRKSFKNRKQQPIVHLLFNDCLSLKLYPKLKSVNTEEISGCVTLADTCQMRGKSYSNPFKRKRCSYQCDLDTDDEVIEFEEEPYMPESFMKTCNTSWFEFVPLTLNICSTIDNTQGKTIHSPVLALIRKEDGSEDRIVGLTRSSNPNNLLVANKIFDNKYELISNETTNMLREINKAQRKVGFL